MWENPPPAGHLQLLSQVSQLVFLRLVLLHGLAPTTRVPSEFPRVRINCMISSYKSQKLASKVVFSQSEKTSTFLEDCETHRPS